MANPKTKIGIVTEDIAALPGSFLKENEIDLAHAILDWPEIEKVPGENIWQKIRNAEKYGVKTLPKTSQATPKSYFDAFKRQFEKGFEKILCLTVSSKISGCYNSAIQAKEMIGEKEKIFIFDTQNAAAGQGLFVLKAIELIREGREIEEILRKLKDLVPKTFTNFILEDPKYLLSVGRITKNQALAIKLMKELKLHPVSGFKEGVIKMSGIFLAKDMAEALFKSCLKSKKKFKKIRAVINECDNPKGAERLKELLENARIEVVFISEGPTLFAAGGPGILVLGWQPIE